MFRSLLALIALSTLAVFVSLSGANPAGAAPQDAKAQEAKPQEPAKPQETPKPQETKSPEAKPQETRPQKGEFTSEQIAESVILVYGTRPGLEQIRRNGVERGKITRETQ